MATAYSNLSEAQIDDMVIGAIQASLPLLGAFSTRLDDTDLVKGDTVRVPLVGAVTVGSKTPGTLVTASGSLTGVDVAVNNFKGGSFELIEGNVSARHVAEWMQGQLNTAVRAVAQSVVDAALALLTNSNFGTGKVDLTYTAANGGTAINVIDAEAVGMIRAAAKGKLKGMPGAFVCNANTASGLLTLQQVVYALGAVQGQNPYVDGKLPSGVLGYDAFEYVDLPANSENLAAAVIGKGAIAVAAGAPSQLLKSGDGNIAYRRIITEPESGLSVQYTEAVDAGGTITCETAVLYGVARGQDAATLVHVAAAV